MAARLAAEFGWQPRLHDPDLAVAKGAALYALSRVVARPQRARRRSATGAGGRRPTSSRRRPPNRVSRSRPWPELVAKRTRTVLPRRSGCGCWTTEHGPAYVEHLVFANDALPTGDRH